MGGSENRSNVFVIGINLNRPSNCEFSLLFSNRREILGKLLLPLFVPALELPARIIKVGGVKDLNSRLPQPEPPLLLELCPLIGMSGIATDRQNTRALAFV